MLPCSVNSGIRHVHVKKIKAATNRAEFWGGSDNLLGYDHIIGYMGVVYM
jgi:hypothetical protein